ncbi:sensor histidine kinase [Glaciibacter psychrotolerans]|uniref:histidine kinase n=1 Tax=Glaciibacter psychrotolerans TaxID=670054 RepID=A0A7Z0EDK7_9MICO|nr:HAMP domain-containing sensor histidine kinase [Leifsonia psychrotolerans]NYJ19665.1 signal transduction histidine kinase [Leifsonia psychrotolerans]
MMRLPGLSIRARITLGSLAVAAILFSTAAFFFRLEVRSILDQTTSTLLRNDAAPIVTDILGSPTAKVEPPAEGQLAAVIDPTGLVQQSTLPHSLAALTTSLTTLDESPQEVQVGHTIYLVMATPVPTSAGIWVIVTARRQEALALLLDELTSVLVTGTVALVIGFGAASWLLTGAALRPVNRLREEAESLSEVGASARLPVPAGRDEVSRLAHTLNAFIDRLRRGVDREKQVVSDASHELRTPLAVLKTQLELAHLNSGDAPALLKDIDAASQTVERLSRLATNLLELSKLESDQAPPETDWTGLCAEITASVDRARITTGTRELEIAYEITGADPHGHYALSRTNVGQLVDNLITNAMTAIGDTGIVTVTLHRDGEDAHLRVVDTGPGMPAGFIPIAFDRFSRTDGSRASGNGGSGLGLAVVHAIVERAGGTISVRNTGTGLAVEATLPRHLPPD